MPQHSSYDVVIVGGAMMGSSTAWWLSRNPDFMGRILVVERDPSYEFASTSHTNSCIRQQFSSDINIRISQFGAEFIRGFRTFMDDPEAPDILLRSFGYLYLADDETRAEDLRTAQRVQAEYGAGTRILSPEELAEQFPFYNLDGIILGSHNPVDEGYFDGGTIFEWFRRKSRAQGVEYVANQITAITRTGNRIDTVTLETGEVISAGYVINASGPRAAATARMAGFDLPVEPRRRYTYIFECPEDLGQDLPLTIDPSGCHMRWDGRYFLCGCPPFEDAAMAFDDFGYEDGIWEEKLWPSIAARVPAFEQVRVVNSWVGHYAFNTLDHNAIIGPHPEVPNFIFCNGFSGHGLQQSPAMGRAVSELVIHGEFRTLDMTPLGYERILTGTPFVETAII
ncbi:MAG: FAD-binding oxidoreductase [Pseudomonadota bacterium]